MKESIYNYYVPYQEKVIFFNGLTKNFFTVSEKNANKFQTIIKNPDNFTESFGPFLDRMRNAGFICEDNANEYDIMMKNYRMSLWPHNYKLMILPTYRCNLSCWYCVQEHRHVDLSANHIAKIKKHLKTYLVENEIKVFHLSWFGGEPLIRYDIILDITAYAKNICQELNIKMDSGITTNSLLLTKDRIKEMGELNINFFQITIDGNREEHNKVKCIPNVDTFSKALNNIVNTVRIIPNVQVNLRINYSNKTLALTEILEEVNEIIPMDIRNHIQISPKRIWQEDDASINQAKLSDITKKICLSGYRVGAIEYGICYVDYKHCTTIFPNGKIDICNLDNQDGRAELSEEGEVIWEQEDLCFQHCADKENIVCNHCKHFPICGGPCPVRRNGMIRERKEVFCMFNNYNIANSRMAQEVTKYYKEFVDN